MKVLFLTGYAGFTQRTHNICNIIKKSNPNIRIIKYLYGQENFEYLKNNKEFEYEKLIEIDNLLYECEKVNQNEEETFAKIQRIKNELSHINLNKAIYAERILTQHTHNTFYSKKMSHIEILKLVTLIYENIIGNLDEVKLVYSYHASSIFSYLLSSICEIKKIEYVVLNHDRITSRWFFSDTNFQLLPPKAVKSYNQGVINKDCEKEVEEYIFNLEKNVRPEFMVFFIKENLNLLKINFRNIKSFLKYFFIPRSKLIYLSQTNYQRVLAKINLKINQYFSKKFFKKKIPSKFKILYFPLQFEPENTTLVAAVDYYDQKALLKLASVQLPPNWKMVVKEHPSMIGRRDYKFYEEISKMHNVEIIDPYFHSLTLVKKSDATISLSGTVALESYSLNKPTIIIGNIFYAILKGMFKLEKLNELHSILLNIEENKHVKFDQKKEVLKLISAIENSPHIKDTNGELWTQKTFSKDVMSTDLKIAEFINVKLKECLSDKK